MKHTLMRARAEGEATKPTFDRRVEVDDAYLGGERQGGRRGRGTVGISEQESLSSPEFRNLITPDTHPFAG